MAQNDLILEIILLISMMTADPLVCDAIASSNIVNLLYQVWKEKSDDIEVQLQLIHCFHRFVYIYLYLDGI